MVLGKAQVIFSCIAVLLTTGASSLKAPIEGYDVFTIPWEVTPSPEAAPQIFEGTIQEVYASAHKVNPHFYHDFDLGNLTLANHTLSNQTFTHNPFTNDTTGIVSKRGDTWNCEPNQNWVPAYYEGVILGIEYLRGLPGKPQRGPGPGSCGRVSCSYQSAIWWCNDNDYTKVLPSYNNIADGAQELVYKCFSKDPWSGLYRFVKGQLFHDDGWNVIVRHDYSDGC